MSSFLSKPSKLVKTAITALKKVAQTHGVDAAGRVVATALQEEWTKTWSQVQGVTPSLEASGLGLTGRKGLSLDHVSYWKRNDSAGTEILTAEEYGLSLRRMDEIVRFCKKHDLDCFVDPLSMHFPTGCVLLIFARKGRLENTVAKMVSGGAEA